MTTIAKRSRGSVRTSLAPEPSPPPFQAGDGAFLIIPVQVIQRVPGGFKVIGSGLNRVAEPHQLLRACELPVGARRLSSGAA